MKNDFWNGVTAASAGLLFLGLICMFCYSLGKTAGREEVWKEGEARGFVERKGWNEQWTWRKP